MNMDLKETVKRIVKNYFLNHQKLTKNKNHSGREIPTTFQKNTEQKS